MRVERNTTARRREFLRFSEGLATFGGVLMIAVGWINGASAPAAEPMHARAAKVDRTEGTPKASDVIMRSLRLRLRGDDEPHDTMQALRDFHATTLAWAYITDAAFIERLKASGRDFGGAVSAPTFAGDTTRDGWFEDLVIVDLEGKPIIAPWKRTWNRTLWGCMNNPTLEAGYLRALEDYVDVGADIMQRDEPGGNLNATRWGGCFCDHCMRAFRGYLGRHTSEADRVDVGIEDLDAFDYRDHLRAQSAPVGDAFGRWDGGRLKQWFVDFQTEATIAFHQRTRAAIDAYAGRRVPFSCNNGVRRWDDIEMEFDWAFGELSYRHATAHYLYEAMRNAVDHGRVQIVTMPKKGDYSDLEVWERKTRQTIATAYACGGLCMVPWDVYMPQDAPRYFGTPEQYADLFGFIRANSRLLDGYGQAAAVGYGVPADTAPKSAGVRLSGADRMLAVVRAVPEDPKAAVVIHLVDWSDSPSESRLMLDPSCFFGDQPIRIRLLRPADVDRSVHETADASGDYQKLSESSVLARGRVVTIDLPALRPWGILVVEPDRETVASPWQPEVWAEPDSLDRETLVVRMACASPDATIRYTVDGSEPHGEADIYSAPLRFRGDTTVRAAAYRDGLPSPTSSLRYERIAGTAEPAPPDRVGDTTATFRLWLDAEAMVGDYDDGDAVPRWKATIGPDATLPDVPLMSGSSPDAPNLVKRGMNGRASLRFDGVDDQLVVPEFANKVLAGRAFTVFIVSRSASGRFGLCGNGLTGSGGLPRLYMTRNAFHYDSLQRSAEMQVPSGETAILTYAYDGESAVTGYVNGWPTGAAAGLPVVEQFGGGHLAMPFWSGNSNQAGELAEVIVFEGPLDEDARRRVTAYLAEKYGISFERKWRRVAPSPARH